MQTAAPAPSYPTRRPLATAAIVLAFVACCVLFVIVDNSYYRFADTRFPHVGSSSTLATLWGAVSRAHLLLILIPLALRRPRLLGFQIGKVREHWRMLLAMLILNCGVIAGYLVLTHSTTPYSGNQWLITEIVTVPFVEETLWRGVVFAVLLGVFNQIYPGRSSQHLVVWLTGVAFGLLHAANALAGVPLAFAVLQALNATVWGVVYGYARAKTGSVYPPMLLHAAMNLVVVLL